MLPILLEGIEEGKEFVLIALSAGFMPKLAGSLFTFANDFYWTNFCEKYMTNNQRIAPDMVQCLAEKGKLLCNTYMLHSLILGARPDEKLDYSTVTTYKDFVDYARLDLVCQHDGNKIHTIKDGIHGFSNPAHKIETINLCWRF